VEPDRKPAADERLDRIEEKGKIKKLKNPLSPVKLWRDRGNPLLSILPSSKFDNGRKRDEATN
jgi:hypothetical protein